MHLLTGDHHLDQDLQLIHEHVYEPYPPHLDGLNHGDQFSNRNPLESQPVHDQSQFSDFYPHSWLDLNYADAHYPGKRNAMAH